jgi:MerR family copper efflux transcriptional regulator
MNIGSVAKLLKLPKETIRYYETIGLIVADRLSNRYRSYNDAHIRKLRFVQKARKLGFSLKECRELL